MNAGRELDALVAEKVMGTITWTHGKAFVTQPNGCRSLGIAVFPNGVDERFVIRDGNANGNWSRGDGNRWMTEALPHYSTDIAAAWQVVEFLQREWDRLDEKESQFWRFEDCHPHGWIARVIWPHDGEAEIASVDADTAPLAICLAALAACGVEVPS
jgi:hypothetical protein